MTDLNFADLRAKLQKATPGPCRLIEGKAVYKGGKCWYEHDRTPREDEDMALIVAAVNALPQLLVKVEYMHAALTMENEGRKRLEAEVERLRMDLEASQTVLGIKTDTCDRLAAEVERLRKERDQQVIRSMVLAASAICALKSLVDEWPQHRMWFAKSPESIPIRELARLAGYNIAAACGEVKP